MLEDLKARILSHKIPCSHPPAPKLHLLYATLYGQHKAFKFKGCLKWFLWETNLMRYHPSSTYMSSPVRLLASLGRLWSVLLSFSPLPWTKHHHQSNDMFTSISSALSVLIPNEFVYSKIISISYGWKAQPRAKSGVVIKVQEQKWPAGRAHLMQVNILFVYCDPLKKCWGTKNWGTV